MVIVKFNLEKKISINQKVKKNEELMNINVRQVEIIIST